MDCGCQFVIFLTCLLISLFPVWFLVTLCCLFYVYFLICRLLGQNDNLGFSSLWQFMAWELFYSSVVSSFVALQFNVDIAIIVVVVYLTKALNSSFSWKLFPTYLRNYYSTPWHRCLMILSIFDVIPITKICY